MATQPPVEPDRIMPQAPPETPPAAPEPFNPYPDETQPLDPDTIEPGTNPEEWPAQTANSPI